jgi:hypothetical protein
MRPWIKLALAFSAITVLVPGWGYWYSLNHVSLQLRVDDYSLKTQHQAYGVPHDVTLTLRDDANELLAMARSVEPQGYILAVHPLPEIGNCAHLAAASQRDYAECYRQYSAWSATWAPRVVRADVAIGSCQLRGVPVTVRMTNNEWMLWWVPLPHVGGVPRRYFEFVVAVDSRLCKAV